MVDILFPSPGLAAMGEQPQKKAGIAMCVGCGSEIRDQYILRVSPDLEWHAACLKCADCSQFLDETCTCFVRDGKTYCKRDYIRLFGIKCAKCASGFSSNDLVMRARGHVYHLECFRCSVCARQLLPGDEFSLRDHELLCRADHSLLLERATAAAEQSPPRSPANLATRTGLQITGVWVPPPLSLPDVLGGKLSPLRPWEEVTAFRLPLERFRARWAAGLPASARAQAGGEDDAGADGAEREAAAHAAYLLRCQPAPGRADEGAAGGDDGPQPAGHPRLVPEQALQGQEEVHPHEAAPAAAAQRQGQSSGLDRNSPGGRQPHPA
uniref:ISL LIM homeobox 2 n=1 Tax=Salvator merianae TaxID=96440 RepID=A0A8D0B618_SALMN